MGEVRGEGEGRGERGEGERRQRQRQRQRQIQRQRQRQRQRRGEMVGANVGGTNTYISKHHMVNKFLTQLVDNFHRLWLKNMHESLR
jgi:hypothetical protein